MSLEHEDEEWEYEYHPVLQHPAFRWVCLITVMGLLFSVVGFAGEFLENLRLGFYPLYEVNLAFYCIILIPNVMALGIITYVFKEL